VKIDLSERKSRIRRFRSFDGCGIPKRDGETEQSNGLNFESYKLPGIELRKCSAEELDEGTFTDSIVTDSGLARRRLNIVAARSTASMLKGERRLFIA